jgi:hypothetical protein
MLAATLVMGAVLVLIKRLPVFPLGETRVTWVVQLVTLMGVGAAVYASACVAMGIPLLNHLLPKRR